METEGVDSLDIVYQIDHGLPSEASTKSFLRMVCNDTSQYYLELNELKAWPNDQRYTVALPHRVRTLSALPWGGANEPIWYMDDPRVRNCTVLTAIGEHLIDGILQAKPAGIDSCTWTNAQDKTGSPIRFKKDLEKVRLLVERVRQAEKSILSQKEEAKTCLKAGI